MQGEERPDSRLRARILDVLSSTRYGVSFSQALSALSLAVQRDPEFLVRLLANVRRFKSDAAARRVGLLVDRLFDPTLPTVSRADRKEQNTGAPAARRSHRRAGRPHVAVIVNASTEPEDVSHERAGRTAATLGSACNCPTCSWD